MVVTVDGDGDADAHGDDAGNEGETMGAAQEIPTQDVTIIVKGMTE